ncbi:Metal tolerance protein 1 [Linum perenne]
MNSLQLFSSSSVTLQLFYSLLPLASLVPLAVSLLLGILCFSFHLHFQDGSHSLRQGQIIEINANLPDSSNAGGNKICAKEPCGFSDAQSNSEEAKERLASMRKLLMSAGFCVLFMAVG